MATIVLLGNRLARPKATVFEIVIMGSNPISPASFRISSANLKTFFSFKKTKVDPVVLHSRRLVARTLPFQGGEAGSIPVVSTNFHSVEFEHGART